MNRLSILIAWRYLLGTTQEKNISTMALICFLGIFIGAFSLALVVCVMNGFEKETHKKLKNIHAQIIINAPQDEQIDYLRIKPVLKEEFKEISTFAPSALAQVIIQHPDSQDVTNVVALKGVDPVLEPKVIDLENKIITQQNDAQLKDLLRGNKIIIGKKLAEQHGLSIGDIVNILYAPDDPTKRGTLTLQKKEAIVSGTISTGIDEFDTAFIMSTLDFLNQLFPDIGITHISASLTDSASEKNVIERLQKRFNLETYSWKDLYPALVAALKLEKYVMFLILVLITLVASMNIISLLFMEITQKKGDIAILKALGLASSNITRIFIFIGMIISLAGSILGLLFAFIIGLILKHYPFIRLPDTYFVTHLPIEMEWHLFIIVFFVILLLSFIATWLPSRATKNINIAHVLRFEA